MDCAQCGQAVPEGVGRCRNCGAPATLEAPSRSNRTLIWILASAVVLLLIAAGVAAALILPAHPQADVASTSSVAEAALPSGAQWVEVTTPDFAGKVDAVAVSDEALVVNTANGLYAVLIDENGVGEPVRLPVSGGEAGSPTVDGTLVAWSEGTRDETTGVFVNQAIYAMRLPDGLPVQVVGSDRAPYYPQLSDGYLSWVQPKPEDGDANSAVWMQPIYRVSVSDDGSPQGEPELLTNAPRAYVLSGAPWAYSFDGALLAWEQHQEAEGLESGVYLMDLATGDTTQLSSTGGRPSIADNIVTYFGEALEGMDFATKRVWTIDTRGDWATASKSFVVYLRGVRRQVYREIVAQQLADHSEQILGRQETHPLAAAPLAASGNHIAYVGDDAKVKLFERRTD